MDLSREDEANPQSASKSGKRKQSAKERKAEKRQRSSQLTQREQREAEVAHERHLGMEIDQLALSANAGASMTSASDHNASDSKTGA